MFPYIYLDHICPNILLSDIATETTSETSAASIACWLVAQLEGPSHDLILMSLNQRMQLLQEVELDELAVVQLMSSNFPSLATFSWWRKRALWAALISSILSRPTQTQLQWSLNMVNSTKSHSFIICTRNFQCRVTEPILGLFG